MADILFPSNGLGDTGFTDTDDGGTGLNIGFIFKSADAGYSVRGIRWRSPSGTSDATAYLFDNNGNDLASTATWSSLGSNWHEAIFTTPVAVAPNEGYIPAVVRSGARAYSYKTSQFPHTGAPFSIDSNMGRWSYSDTPFLDDATSNASQSWYGIDAILSNDSPPDPDPPVETTYRKGARSVVAIRRGSREVTRIMKGRAQVWPTHIPAPPDPDPDPPGDEVPGWLRTTSNTGLAAAGVSEGMLTDYTATSPSGGVLTINANQTRRRINLGTNQLRFAAGVVLTECLIIGSRIGGQGQIYLNTANVTLKHCDIRSTVTPTGDNETIGVHGSVDGFQMLGCYMHNFTIPAWLDGSTGAATSYVNDCLWVANVWTGGTAHRDGFTRRSGHARIEFHRSYIASVGNYVTGAVFLQSWSDTVGSLGNMHWYDCMFESASYVLALEHANNLSFVNNRYIATGYGPKSVTKGAVISTWTDNYIYANDPGNDYKGALIP